MKFQNFYIWRGRLPHWRADKVTYYACFKHKRALSEDEREIIFSQLIKLHGKKWNIVVVCVLPEKTELIVVVGESLRQSVDLSNILEPAKRKAGQKIVELSGEVYPPFYGESYDRIMRSEQEQEEFFSQIAAGPFDLALTQNSAEYPYFWCSEEVSS